MFHEYPQRTIAAADALSQQAAALADCRKCKLCLSRTQVVFGALARGRSTFVGRAPDFTKTSRASLVGRPSLELLAGIGLSRPQIYIGNVVKCRPPNNVTSCR